MGKYQRKTTQKWTEDDMQNAVKAFREGRSMRHAAELFKVPRTCLRRRLENNTLKNKGGQTIFTAEQENALATRITRLCDIGFGMTREDVMKVAFDFAEGNKIRNNFSKEKRQAGKDWFVGFINRHPLSLRKPEGLSVARAEGLNKDDVSDYFAKLKTVMEETGVLNKPNLIYNVDETGCVLNNRQTQKVVAQKGSKLVVKQTSVERGELVTIVACCSATGHYIQPMAIFKGKKFHREWEDGFPAGAKVCMSDSGWINEELFLEWLKHFQANRVAGPCVLILDGHVSHKTLPALLFCERNNITLLSLPSHTTQRLQPLDRTFFRPFKLCYDRECNTFMAAHQGERNITKFNFGHLLKKAWCKAATIDNAVNGFRSTGIFPLNPGVLTEVDFQPSCSVENGGNRPKPTALPSTPRLSAALPLTSGQSPKVHSTSGKSSSLPSIAEHSPALPLTTRLSPALPSTSGQSCPPTDESVLDSPPFRASTPVGLLQRDASVEVNISFHELLPTPEKRLKQTRSRKQKSEVLTSPVAIQEAQKRDERKNVSSKNTQKKLNNSKKRVAVRSSSSEEEEQQQEVEEEEGDNTACGFCFKSYRDPGSSRLGDWVECMKCSVWYHENCVGGKGQKRFVCGKCI